MNMPYSYPKVKKQNNQFGPTELGHYYMPAPYHNRKATNNHDKTKWILKQDEQYEVFRVGDESQWLSDKPSGIFSILNNGQEVFGERGERIAFFPYPANEIDPWHGYPVKCQYVPDPIAEKWFSDSTIDRIQYNRIIAGRL